MRCSKRGKRAPKNKSTMAQERTEGRTCQSIKRKQMNIGLTFNRLQREDFDKI